MKLTKTTTGYKVTLSSKEWTSIGIEKGWIKTNKTSADNRIPLGFGLQTPEVYKQYDIYRQYCASKGIKPGQRSSFSQFKHYGGDILSEKGFDIFNESVARHRAEGLAD